MGPGRAEIKQYPAFISPISQTDKGNEMFLYAGLEGKTSFSGFCVTNINSQARN
jgi:hypothetical protein